MRGKITTAVGVTEPCLRLHTGVCNTYAELESDGLVYRLVSSNNGLDLPCTVK